VVEGAAYPAMLRRSRDRPGLRECRAAWLLGLTVREYRALEAGDAAIVTRGLRSRMVDVFPWPAASGLRGTYLP
jgi:hypothetical protein